MAAEMKGSLEVTIRPHDTEEIIQVGRNFVLDFQDSSRKNRLQWEALVEIITDNLFRTGIIDSERFPEV